MSTEPMQLRFLGPLRISRGRTAVPVAASQKTRALLAFLAVNPRSHRRERLCELLWSGTDDPRAGLRWSLSKLRALNDADATRICTDRESVSFEPHGALVDALEVRRRCAGGVDQMSVTDLQSALALFGGGFLDELELPDLHDFQAWRVAEREQFRRLQLDLLRALCTRLSEDPEAALGPARELVRFDPQDPRARAQLIQLLAASGRREEAEEHYTLGRKQAEDRKSDADLLRSTWHSVASQPTTTQAVEHEEARQEVRFCTAPDGVRIALATLGQGAPLVKTANWMTHLDYDHKSPLWRHLARELSRDFRLIRYDQRGNGLSDWDVRDFSLEACVGDLEAVVDAVGLTRFPLLGISQGCRVSIAYALKHPDRVTHLVLYGGGARGFKQRPPGAAAARAGLQSLIREGWGRDIPAFRQVFTTLFMPDASLEQARWFNELQRVSTSAENAVRITEASAEVDLRAELPKVRVPTLVMHATQDAMVPFDEGRILAASIPDARFVALESRNHLLLDDEPAFARFLQELRGFLATDTAV